MAITTIYNGIEYRSRLEARWAAFMQNIGWDIVYEPFDGDGYIPDFLVQGAKPLLVEIKPAVTQSEYEAAVPKVEQGLEKHWRHDILILGAAPISHSSGALLHAGCVGYALHTDPDPNVAMLWAWGAADWLRCMECRTIRVRTADFAWDAQPCGHDHKRTQYAAAREINEAWADACNDVKWRGKAA